jgi:Domain of unknown function (DUF4349)
VALDEVVLDRGAGEVGAGPGGAPPGGGGWGGRVLRGLMEAVLGHPVVVVIFVIVGVLLAVGIAGGLKGSTSDKTSAQASSAVTSVAGPAGASAGSGSAAAAPAASHASSAGPGAVPALPDRVIKTGSLNLQVRVNTLIPSINTMTDESAGLGGFVASSSTNTGTPGVAPTGDITLRVPAQNFSALLTDVEKLGRATAVVSTGQDVTGQYVDLQARIQSLEDARTQFQQILTRATTIGDILTVEQQITSQQTQIEQLQGQLKVLDDQSSYSTLTVHVVEAVPAGAPHPAKPAGGLSRAWTHARHSFARGFDSIVAFSGGFALFLVVVAVLAGLARLVWVVVRRRPA